MHSCGFMTCRIVISRWLPRITGKFPGYLSPSMDLKFADIPNGLAAVGKVPVAGWAQILAYMAFCEISQKQIPGTPAYDGDFGWKVITSDDPEIKKKKLNSEIANGRLAMMGIIGLFFQDGLTGSPWGYWAGNPSSFWKAFENELGVQAPFGFWDPIGFTADGDVDAFKRRRATELKHGRIAASSERALSSFVFSVLYDSDGDGATCRHRAGW